MAPACYASWNNSRALQRSRASGGDMTNASWPGEQVVCSHKPFVPIVGSIGGAGFSRALFDTLNSFSNVDLYSAFLLTSGSQLQLICAGDATQRSDAPTVLSRKYAEKYWRLDPMMADIVTTGQVHSYGGITRQVWKSIPDPEYRSTCYVAPKVVERVSARVRSGRDIVLVSIYRRRETGCFSERELQRFEEG